ncbi:MAG: hypothetical protein ACK5LY_06845 [Lachnospirales bacterium]
MYSETCDIFELQEIEKENGSTGAIEVEVVKGKPCKLSFSSNANVSSGNDNNSFSVVQSIKLFLDKDIEVKPGSKIIIYKEGKRETFESSGKPIVQIVHQEIGLKYEGYA